MLGSGAGGRWVAAHARWWVESRAKSRTEAVSALGTTAVQVVAYAAAIAILAALIAGRRLDIGDYVVLTGAAAAFQGELEGLLQQVRYVMQDLPTLRDLQAFLDEAASAGAYFGTAPFPRPLQEGLEVLDLCFRYPGAAEDTLRGVSFRVRPGETVAILGANGAGKSTLIKLLLGLYLPTRGVIRYDGTDLAAIDPFSRRTARPYSKTSRATGGRCGRSSPPGTRACSTTTGRCGPPPPLPASGNGFTVCPRAWTRCWIRPSPTLDRAANSRAGSGRSWRSRAPWPATRRSCSG